MSLNLALGGDVPTVPLGLGVTVIAVGAVAVGVTTDVAVTDALAIALAGGSLALVASRHARVGALLVCLAGGALADGAWRRDRRLMPPLLAWFAHSGVETRNEEPVWVDGTLIEDAEPAEEGVRLAIGVQSVRQIGGAGRRAGVRAPGEIQVHVSGNLAARELDGWTAGRPIGAPVLLRRPQVYLNPGSPSERTQQLRRTFTLVGTIKSGALVEVRPARWWDEWAAALRRHVRWTAARFVAPCSPASAAVLEAILIGDPRPASTTGCNAGFRPRARFTWSRSREATLRC